MRDPKIVLKHLSSLKEDQSVTNIYKNLYNPEFYKIAYQNLYSKPGQMTQASNGSTIDGMSEERINKLIQSLRDKTYKPTPLKRINISNKSGKIRSVNIPSFDDKLVQEIIRMLLEALYESHFLDCSHGYRPNSRANPKDFGRRIKKVSDINLTFFLLILTILILFSYKFVI